MQEVAFQIILHSFFVSELVEGLYMYPYLLVNELWEIRAQPYCQHLLDAVAQLFSHKSHIQAVATVRTLLPSLVYVQMIQI